jgi:hypothetical protein
MENINWQGSYNCLKVEKKMSIVLYDLKRTRDLNEANPWSPNTWKTRFLLNIKVGVCLDMLN